MKSKSMTILGSIGILLITASKGVTLETNSPTLNSQETSQTEDFESPKLRKFWEDSAKLIQEQLNVISRVENALNSPDVKEVEKARANLFLYQGKVRDFFREQYAFPQRLCYNNINYGNNNQFNSNQEKLYCTLYQLNQQLSPLLPILDQRISKLSELSPANPIYGKFQPFPNTEPPLISQSNLGITSTPIPVIGRSVKTAVADSSFSINPAIQPSNEAVYYLENNRKILLSLSSLFSNSITFVDPAKTREAVEYYSYNLDPKEIAIYSDFLKEKNRGVSLIVDSKNYYPDPQEIQNRLTLSIPEKYPFPPLKTEQEDFTPRLILQVNDNLLEIPIGILNYGFMVNVGDIPLEKIKSNLDNISSLSTEAKSFLLSYTPPTKLENIQVDQRRFLTGKTGLGENYPTSFPVSSQLPIELNKTYIIRLIQYQLPEVVITGKPISRQERFYLDEILKTYSNDVLVAVRPVRKNLEGNYTFLWQVLEEFPTPEIKDLENYVLME